MQAVSRLSVCGLRPRRNSVHCGQHRRGNGTYWHTRHMPITVRQLSSTRRLRLTVRAGEGNLDRELSWAHVSELEDPTAFLSGGELLLMTGVALPSSVGGVERWVKKLAASGVAAIGFGVGLHYDTIPEPFVRAAAEEQLPLLEVPFEIPFIDLEKVVSRALSADDHARLQRSHQHQRRLIHAASATDGAFTLVRRTAELIDGWTAFLDSAGTVIESSGRPTPGTLMRMAEARARRPVEIVFVTAEGEDVISQLLLDLDGEVLGYLVAGRGGVVGSLDHGVVTIAAALMTILARRSRESQRGLARARTAALTLLRNGQAELGRELAAELWGELPQPPTRVIAVSGPSSALDTAIRRLDVCARVESTVFGCLDGRLVVWVTNNEVDAAVSRLGSVEGICLGISSEVRCEEFARGLREGAEAAAAAAREGRRQACYEEFENRGLRSFLDLDRARVYADKHLSVLNRAESAESADLRQSLFCWLAHNGLIDPAARELGIHRHTLRRRLTRVEQLLDVSLASPTTRSELWLELVLTSGLMEPADTCNDVLPRFGRGTAR